MPNETDTAFHYRLLKLIEERPEISQRELAAELGLSLGKVNYCLKAFIARGLVKVSNFRRSDNKLAYAYLLTPMGIEEKAKVALQFFRRIKQEYEFLKQEVGHLDQQQASPAGIYRVPPETVKKICASLPGVIAVYVFGSSVSGRMHGSSDLDLAVLADMSIDPEQLWRLAQEIAAMLGVDVDLIDLRRASAVMRIQVIQGGSRLFCRDQVGCDGFEDFAYSDFARLNEERAGILEDIKQRGTVYG